MWIHRTVHNLCTQKPPNDYSQQIYDRYGGVYVDYNKQTVSNIPCLRLGFDSVTLFCTTWANGLMFLYVIRCCRLYVRSMVNICWESLLRDGPTRKFLLDGYPTSSNILTVFILVGGLIQHWVLLASYPSATWFIKSYSPRPKTLY